MDRSIAPHLCGVGLTCCEAERSPNLAVLLTTGYELTITARERTTANNTPVTACAWRNSQHSIFFLWFNIRDNFEDCSEMGVPIHHLILLSPIIIVNEAPIIGHDFH